MTLTTPQTEALRIMNQCLQYGVLIKIEPGSETNSLGGAVHVVFKRNRKARNTIATGFGPTVEDALIACAGNYDRRKKAAMQGSLI